MKQKVTIVGIMIMLTMIFSTCTRQSDFPVLKGSYLGQEPPGDVPELFAPGIISIKEKNSGNITFSPDLKEIYFSRRTPLKTDNRIWFSRLENEKLTIPEPAPFTYNCLEEYSCFTPDGKRLYYKSRRPLPGEDTLSKKLNVWFVDRINNGWSEPQFLGSPLNDYNPVYFSFENNGTLYFLRPEPREISYTELKDGQYSEIKRMPEEINYLNGVHHPAIAPDGSYILFDSFSMINDDLTGFLHISFKKPDGSWTKAMSMRKVFKVSESVIYCNSRITPDGKYIFFQEYKYKTEKAELHWVSSKIIEELKSDDLK